jgi:hypothetical protein
VLLFAPMRAWAIHLVPYTAEARQPTAITLLSWLNRHKLPLGAVILVGAVLGLLLVLAESTEGGGAPSLARFALVAAVYVGLETAGLLIGYVSLREPSWSHSWTALTHAARGHPCPRAQLHPQPAGQAHLSFNVV